MVSRDSHSDCRIERDLLLLCARTVRSEAACIRIGNLLSQNLDWDAFLALADHNEVVQLVAPALLSEPLARVPESVRERLRGRWSYVAAKNMRLASDLVKVTQLLAGARIECLPLKGPVLALSAYGSLSARQFDDIDILVRRGDVLNARHTLVAHGYRCLDEPSFDSRSKHFSLNDPTGNVIIEVHWSLHEPDYRFRFDDQSLFATSSRVELLGESFLWPRYQELLLVLAAHGCRHGWESLKWICDVAELLRRHVDSDLTPLLDEARKLGCYRMAALALRLASDWLAAPLPQNIRAVLAKDLYLTRLVAKVDEKLFARGKASRALPAEIAGAAITGLKFSLLSRERFTDKLALFGCYISDRIRPNEHDGLLLKRAGKSRAVSWLVRPWRLVRVYGSSFAALFTRPNFSSGLIDGSRTRAHTQSETRPPDATSEEQAHNRLTGRGQVR